MRQECFVKHILCYLSKCYLPIGRFSNDGIQNFVSLFLCQNGVPPILS